MNRTWRTVAIGWFDAMNQEIGNRFDRAFLHALHRTLNVGDVVELRIAKSRHEKIAETILRCREASFGENWEFQLRCETLFAALCDLALEDFR